jgi:hypothetical protein
MLYAAFDRLIDTADFVITGAADIMFVADPVGALIDFDRRDTSGAALFMATAYVGKFAVNGSTKLQKRRPHGSEGKYPWPYDAFFMTPVVMAVKRMRARGFARLVNEVFPWLLKEHPYLERLNGGLPLADMAVFSLLAKQHPELVIIHDCRYGMTVPPTCSDKSLISVHFPGPIPKEGCKLKRRSLRNNCRRHRFYAVIYRDYDNQPWPSTVVTSEHTQLAV